MVIQTVHDRIYGKFEICESVLIELINCPTVQRLKEISQYGLPENYYKLAGFSRYEHSIGVMLLLRKFRASIKEQIAGLIHDLSHTAFSHLVDLILGDRKRENYQDLNFETKFLNSEVPEILERYKLDYKEFIDLEKFSLLEQSAPRLCADRLDYSIREISLWPCPIAKIFIQNLHVFEGKFVFTNPETAHLFALSYAQCQREHWGGANAVTRWYAFSEILRYALAEKIISQENLYQTDSFVIRTLEKSANKKILRVLACLLETDLFISDENSPIRQIKKFRYVDPEISFNDFNGSLSELCPEYQKFLEEQKEINKRGIGIPRSILELLQ